MRSLQRLAIVRPVGASMVFGALALLGALALSRLEVNLLPEIKLPRITILTRFPNAAPEEIEYLITRPITEAAGTVSGVADITSISSEGLSQVTVQLRWGRNVDFAVMELRERVDQIRNMLPQQSERPIISRFDPSERPFFEIVVFPTGLEKVNDLKFFARNELRTRFERVDGVAMVELSGGYDREIQVALDPARMEGYDISFEEVLSAIRSTNQNIPAGHITVGNKDVLIRTLGEYERISEIADTVVGQDSRGASIKISDIGAVVDGYRERRDLALYNGKECVLLSLRKEAGKNTVATAAAVREELVRVHRDFGRTVALASVYDESRFISESISNISGSLAAGAVLAFISLFLILRNATSPLIILAIIPVSLLSTFLLMYIQGLSLNIMSLGGLSLGVGMLFDSGNVILSAIERHRLLGLGPRDAALKGGAEASASVTVAVLTTVIVFLPVVFVDSVAGLVFKEMAITITFSLLSSLVVSLLLTPMLAARRESWGLDRLFAQSPLLKKAETAERRLQKRYEALLQFCLDRPRRLIVLSAALFAGALLLLPFVEREFLPAVDSGELTVEIRLPDGSSLRQTQDAAASALATIQRHPDVEHIIARIGEGAARYAGRVQGAEGVNQATLRIIMKPERDKTSAALAESIREEIKFRPEVDFTVRLSGDALTQLLSPDASPIVIDIAGEDLVTLEALGAELRSEIAKIRGVTDVRAAMDERPSEYHVYFQMDRLALAGLNVAAVAADLRTAIDGEVASAYRLGDDEIDIRVKADSALARDAADLSRMSLRPPQGVRVAVSQITEIKPEAGYSSIMLRGTTRINRITANFAEDANHNQVRTRVESATATLPLQPGYSAAPGGEQEQIGESFRELGLAFLLAIVLIFMLLAGQFESLKHATVMMVTIPMIFIGIAPAMLITGKSLNVSAFTGIILLVGIVVDNAALFHEYMTLLEEEGFELRLAALEAGKIVLRPLLLNNGTTLLGLIPVALQLGEGTEFQSPMGIAVISGLTASVFLSLFLTPTLFYLLKLRRTQ